MFRGREPEYFHSCSVKIHPKRHFSFSVPRSSIRRSGNFGDYGWVMRRRLHAPSSPCVAGSVGPDCRRFLPLLASHAVDGRREVGSLGDEDKRERSEENLNTLAFLISLGIW